jgi:hypothetical protein
MIPRVAFFLPVLASLSCLYGLQIQDDLVQIHTLPQNAPIKGQITLQNTEGQAEKVLVEIVDYLPHAEGRTEFLKAGSLERSISSWIQIKNQEVIIAPNSNFVLDYEIQAPASLAPGSYWSMIRLVPDSAADQSGVQQRVAYGMQVIVRQTPTPEGSVSVENLKVEGDAAKRELRCDLKNTAVSDMLLHSKIEVFDSAGQKVFQTTGQTQRLYPGSDLSFSFPLDVKSGSYQAFLMFEDGEDNFFGVQRQIDVAP